MNHKNSKFGRKKDFRNTEKKVIKETINLIFFLEETNLIIHPKNRHMRNILKLIFQKITQIRIYPEKSFLKSGEYICLIWGKKVHFRILYTTKHTNTSKRYFDFFFIIFLQYFFWIFWKSVTKVSDINMRRKWILKLDDITSFSKDLLKSDIHICEGWWWNGESKKVRSRYHNIRVISSKYEEVSHFFRSFDQIYLHLPR